MADSDLESTGAATAQPDGQDPKEVAVAESSLKELKNALYARCANQPADKVFEQTELFEFGIIPNNDLGQLLLCVKQLTQDGLFKVQSKNGNACWKVVKKEDAAKYKSLSAEEGLVFSYIETAGRDGIWTKILRVRTNLHMTVLHRCLKSMEKKNFIKPTKNVKFPNRKAYMLAHLQPSEASTGGAFYTDGVLDEEFVHQMAIWTEKYVIGRSWWHPPMSEGTKKRDKAKLSRVEAERLREIELERGQVNRDRNKDMLPMPPGYLGYPTLSEITRAVNASGLSAVVMREAEMGSLLDVLRWDGKVEKVPNSKAYKAVRQAGEWDGVNAGTSLPEAPCGRCPVFDICADNGPVNAKTCEYFEDWLNIL